MRINYDDCGDVSKCDGMSWAKIGTMRIRNKTTQDLRTETGMKSFRVSTVSVVKNRAEDAVSQFVAV
jgi:hypothetical protein